MFLFLHGLIGSAAHFDAIGQALPKHQKWRAPPLPYPHVGLPDLTRDLANLIRTEADGPVVIVGNSIGCVLALELAHLADHLVLTGPPFDHDTGKVPLRRDGLERFVRALFTPNLSPDIADKHVAQAVACLDHLTGSRNMLRETRRLRAISQSFPDHPNLSTNDDKITCLTGALDFMAPERAFRTHMARVAPRAQLHFIPDCGHAVPVEAPRAVLDVLRPMCCAPDAA